MDLSVVIPTYNEAENIQILIERVFRVFHEHSLDGEIIIVDDNSPDGTQQVASQLRSTFINLEVLRRLNKRRPSSAAVLDGIQLARGNMIGVMDAELSLRIIFCKLNCVYFGKLREWLRFFTLLLINLNCFREKVYAAGH
ncbi:MAG TPA: glycosyltransferase [Thermodesulfobacteriota bacterium]|jgi:glycosyltransferase involved in cell wall biosynthesis|nr:glycosyltransferase [Thermodesulfobacteriota bacterium]